MKISPFTREKLVSLMGNPAAKEFCDTLEKALASGTVADLTQRLTDMEAAFVVEAETSETLLQAVAGLEDLINGLAQRVKALEATARTVEDIDPLTDVGALEDVLGTETAADEPPVDPASN